MNIQPLTPSIGARVEGVKLGAMDAETFGQIKAAFLKHCMLVFPGQFLQPDDQLAFARMWGEIAVTPMITYAAGYPGLLQPVNPGKAPAITEDGPHDRQVQTQAPGGSRVPGEPARTEVPSAPMPPLLKNVDGTAK